MAVSADEKILGLALLAERQQKDLADTLAVMGEAVNSFKRLSGEVSKEVNASVGAEIKSMDVGRLISERTAECFAGIEAEAEKLQKQAVAINRNAFEMRSVLVKQTNTLSGWFWWIVGVGAATAVLLPTVATLTLKAQLDDNLEATSAVYHQLEEIKKSLPVSSKKP